MGKQPTITQVQFKLVALLKNRLVTKCELSGQPLEVSSLTSDDLEMCLATERFLERLFGYRFHIIIERSWTEDAYKK